MLLVQPVKEGKSGNHVLLGRSSWEVGHRTVATPRACWKDCLCRHCLAQMILFGAGTQFCSLTVLFCGIGNAFTLCQRAIEHILPQYIFKTILFWVLFGQTQTSALLIDAACAVWALSGPWPGGRALAGQLNRIELMTSERCCLWQLDL